MSVTLLSNRRVRQSNQRLHLRWQFLKLVKTHYSHLGGKTIGTSYTRGDNIYYQGKNFVYTSHLDSNDGYTDPANEGFTEFSDLLRLGAIRGAADVRRHERWRRFGFTRRHLLPSQPGPEVCRSPSRRERADLERGKTHRQRPLPPGDRSSILRTMRSTAVCSQVTTASTEPWTTTVRPRLIPPSPNKVYVDFDADNNKNLLDGSNNLEHFSVADFVDFIQTLAFVRLTAERCTPYYAGVSSRRMKSTRVPQLPASWIPTWPTSRPRWLARACCYKPPHLW